jgi:predicted MPP superfamily phosphohydrolase
VKVPRLSRRQFIATAMLATPCALGADAGLIEPTWLKTRRLRIGAGPFTHRLVHFSDVHHKGNCQYLQDVVDCINSLKPDFVCFTGDIIEDGKFLDEALAYLGKIQAPLFGVPGNHDYWSRVSFAPIHKCFNATGGGWLIDERREIADGKINLIGASCSHANQARAPLSSEAKNILLMHYPAWAKKLGGQQFDLMLAGHSHGGQVRIPFYGSIIVPFGVDEYDMGLFHTPAGPLYVNPGIGYIGDYDIRFNCRPEITVIEI